MKYVKKLIGGSQFLAIGLAVMVLQFTQCQPASTAEGDNSGSVDSRTDTLSRYKVMKPLGDEEARVIRDKGTERAFTGVYHDHFEPGIYYCRQCGAPLYLSEHKFESDCGWPAFDDELTGAVVRRPDIDGMRTEIVCASCSGHLGHVFKGERLTDKNLRHCVNSISMVFQRVQPDKEDDPAVERAMFAGGCFWGVEHLLEKTPGVIEAVSGYSGGYTKDPTYKAVCTGKTGHAETVLIRFDPKQISYEKLARLFFEIHDPTTMNRQGPDIGSQYRSAVYYFNEEQKKTALKLIGELRLLGWDVVTQVAPADKFYPAEDYHQDYIEHNPTRHICHRPINRFEQGPGGK